CAAGERSRWQEKDRRAALDLHYRSQRHVETCAVRREPEGARPGSAQTGEGNQIVQIAKDTVVSLTYELHGADGQLVEKTDKPISYLHGGYDGIFARVEQVLEGQASGFACK